jgi:hypothetical protein
MNCGVGYLEDFFSTNVVYKDRRPQKHITSRFLKCHSVTTATVGG